MVACHFVQGESFFKAVAYSNLLELRDANRGRPVNAVGDQAANGLIDIPGQHKYFLHNRKKNSYRDIADFPIVL
jgi:hypothetical protein